MVAVILLVLELLDEKNKDEFIEDVFIATTGWLVKDNSLNDLVNLINEKYDVKLLGLASPLNFKSSKYKELKDYELGHVKEGVGAGGISLLAFLDGFKNEEIVSLCQQNLEMMKGLGQISLEKDCWMFSKFATRREFLNCGKLSLLFLLNSCSNLSYKV